MDVRSKFCLAVIQFVLACIAIIYHSKAEADGEKMSRFACPNANLPARDQAELAALGGCSFLENSRDTNQGVVSSIGYFFLAEACLMLCFCLCLREEATIADPLSRPADGWIRIPEDQIRRLTRFHNRCEEREPAALWVEYNNNPYLRECFLAVARLLKKESDPEITVLTEAQLNEVRQTLWEAFRCPLTLDAQRVPSTTRTLTGEPVGNPFQAFERDALERALAATDTHPLTRDPVQRVAFPPHPKWVNLYHAVVTYLNEMILEEALDETWREGATRARPHVPVDAVIRSMNERILETALDDLTFDNTSSAAWRTGTPFAQSPALPADTVAIAMG